VTAGTTSFYANGGTRGADGDVGGQIGSNGARGVGGDGTIAAAGIPV
jgi:hypothetical protein